LADIRIATESQIYTQERKHLQSCAGLFAAKWRGKTLKGSKHSGGSPTPSGNKNPRQTDYSLPNFINPIISLAVVTGKSGGFFIIWHCRFDNNYGT